MRKVLMHSENRQRLNELPEEVSRRIDEAVLDLAEGVATGIALPNSDLQLFTTGRGDRIYYSIDASAVYVDAFVAKE